MRSEAARDITPLRRWGGLVVLAGLAGVAFSSLLRVPYALELGAVLVMVGITMWIAGGRTDETRRSGGHQWSTMAKVLYWIEFAVLALYVLGSSVLILFAGGWHATSGQVVILLVLIGAYLIGAVAILTWSLIRWRRAEWSGYFLPLVIPIMSFAVPLLLNVSVDVFDLRLM